MARLSGTRVLVAGAGAIGSAIALRLQDEDAEVTLADPAALGANASGVAAGMLAPAFEAALDPLSAGHFKLLKAARDRWPELAARLSGFGVGLELSGALWVGDPASNASMLDRLADLGAQAKGLEAAAAERLSPGLRAPHGAVWTTEDWSLEPVQMLAALRAAFEANGGVTRPSAVRRWRSGEAVLADGNAVGADVLVMATGFAVDGMDQAPPELDLLAPIKGQLALIDTATPASGPVVRCKGVYLVPRASGPVVGATMEAGARDIEVDTATVSRLKAGAAVLFPELASAPATGAAGVRASTPDGLPLVGPSRVEGMRLAVGARRNGWLLAPLIAEVVADQLSGDSGGRWGRLFDPARF